MDLYLNSITMHYTPQRGGWCVGVSASTGATSDAFKKADNGGDDLVIVLNMKLVDTAVGADVNFSVFLDDDIQDVLSNAEDRSAGAFKASKMGAATFNFKGPKEANNNYPAAGSDNAVWSYTLNWSMQ